MSEHIHFSLLRENGDSGEVCHPALCADEGVCVLIAELPHNVRAMVVGRLKEISETIERIAERLKIPTPALCLSVYPGLIHGAGLDKRNSLGRLDGEKTLQIKWLSAEQASRIVCRRCNGSNGGRTG